ncbi:hypothetical protein LZ318_31445 [Saccharopolyspora indica]|uniref:hypothetical protein n=1 Tax=Saccharopolyspora indica TaxID=1229659 RepID=UPI0022EAB900|nr:hypothetical protein [Saccharopolyspora indica]MDA3644250.1 hypothetical protein [Saccharopolyspora indica]
METEEIARGWAGALANPDDYYDLSAPDCKVWHSSDNKWMATKDAIDAVKAHGGLPTARNTSYTLTEKGFIVQATLTLRETTVHIVQVATVNDGKVVSIEEYIGPEMDIAV